MSAIEIAAGERLKLLRLRSTQLITFAKQEEAKSELIIRNYVAEIKSVHEEIQSLLLTKHRDSVDRQILQVMNTSPVYSEMEKHCPEKHTLKLHGDENKTVYSENGIVDRTVELPYGENFLGDGASPDSVIDLIIGNNRKKRVVHHEPRTIESLQMMEHEYSRISKKRKKKSFTPDTKSVSFSSDPTNMNDFLKTLPPKMPTSSKQNLDENDSNDSSNSTLHLLQPI